MWSIRFCDGASRRGPSIAVPSKSQVARTRSASSFCKGFVLVSRSGSQNDHVPVPIFTLTGAPFARWAVSFAEIPRALHDPVSVLCTRVYREMPGAF